MKKLLVLSLAVVMVVAFTLPASAFESVFGGYWRTRAFSQQDFSGLDDSAQDVSRVDTRTRLYYTAILNDNLKFVNRFEFDAVWGDTGYGDIGTDGQVFEIKQSYADFTVGALRFTVGAQGHQIGRGFVFDDDYAGVTASFKMGDHLIPFTWARINEGGTNNNSQDADLFALWPVFQLGEAFTLNPYLVYEYSDNTGRSGAPANAIASIPAAADDGVGIYWIGANVDASLGAFNLWGTAIYQGGNADSTTVDDFDVQAYLFALGGNVPLGPASLHGQFVYASGDDDATDNDLEAFFGPNGQSYYWSEIMGFGTFDNQVSAGSPGNKISNIWFANIGATIQPMEKLSLTGDIWYASLVEENANNDDVLGVEVDIKASYQLIEGLNLDVVGAYLFADDATTTSSTITNDENPWEVGTRLSLSF
jgi:hypothetical protein